MTKQEAERAYDAEHARLARIKESLSINISGVWSERQAKEIMERLRPELPEGISVFSLEITSQEDSHSKLLLKLSSQELRNALLWLYRFS